MGRFSIPVGIKHPVHRSAASLVTDGDAQEKNLCDSPLMKVEGSPLMKEVEYGS